MKIMLDTNVIISALIFGGKTQKLLKFLLASEHEILISEYVNQEFYDKIKENGLMLLTIFICIIVS
ncbi:MAG: hypothetical protein IJQ99_07870 [Synergistaceae bacterium]|nr:hypothetical protein [Synergistaceae bacterium]